MFENVRHGARAPQALGVQIQPPGFQVPDEMLTASGMRQRYLLGKMNRERYIDIEGVIDPVYNPKQIWV